MKRNISIILLLTALLMSACNFVTGGTASNSGVQDRSLSEQTELIVGTLKLEGSDQAITSQQASQLLPLWQAMKYLNSSDTAAPQEVDALVDQIKGTLTSKQLQAIADMKLTQQDVSEIEQGQDIASNSQQQNSSSQSQSNGGGFGPPEGDLGIGLLGGGTLGTGQSVNSSQTTTVQTGASNQVPSVLIDSLIEFLKKKAES